ncbi:hypothetical protein N7G274_007704 [Stereocaulon virgatum]|uniref:Uncharacterized protein n=1 Tax=Stereocaulon virgatum TaxID=373712 RepID=A0ABR4A0H3_9LECA
MSVSPPPPPPQVIIRKAPPQSPAVGHDQALVNKVAALLKANAAGIEEVTKCKDYSESEGSNPGKDWLTYESVYNHVKFQHTKSRLLCTATM